MAAYNHTGQVVTDLERSQRFYQEVLGFTPWFQISPPDEATSKLMQLQPPLDATVSYLTLDGFVLELICYGADGAAQPFRERTMSEPGLTHLSIAVDDIHATADKVAEYGGQVVDGTDIGNALFIRDPDGQLLELLPSSYRTHLPPKP
jgi:catechol 2,3-dioxygenase-like lactoylglutathione lyase family enzyme